MEKITIKIILLEEMKKDLEEQHAALVEAFNFLKNSPLFCRDADNTLLDEMHAKLVAINHINKYLYPLCWERDQHKVTMPEEDLKK